MLELYKRNGEETAGGVLLNIETHHDVPSKYGCNLMFFTGVDKEVGNIITFGIGLLSNLSSVKSAWWIMGQFIDRCSLVKKPLRKLYAPLHKKIFPMLNRELPA
jgi:hypothetical protein